MCYPSPMHYTVSQADYDKTKGLDILHGNGQDHAYV